jgi:hypothetical protein
MSWPGFEVAAGHGMVRALPLAGRFSTLPHGLTGKMSDAAATEDMADRFGNLVVEPGAPKRRHKFGRIPDEQDNHDAAQALVD